MGGAGCAWWAALVALKMKNWGISGFGLNSIVVVVGSGVYKFAK